MSKDDVQPLLQEDEEKCERHTSSHHLPRPTSQVTYWEGTGPNREASMVGIKPEPTPEFRSYRRRFYILTVFGLFSSCQNAVWNTFGPIAAISEDMFGWTDGTIALLNNWGPISYILASFFFSWMMQVKGLRLSVLLSSFLVAVGTLLRCISTTPPTVTWLAHTAQFLNGLAGPVAMAGPPVISAVWFPAGQRTTATGLSMLVSVLGLAASFIVGPYLVPQRNMKSTHSLTSSEIHSVDVFREEKEKFLQYMYYEAVICWLVFLLILAYFPDKPPHSPSMAATVDRDGFSSGLRNLIGKRLYWEIGFVYGVTQGILNCWSTVLDVNLKPHGISQEEAGWIGFHSTIGGCVGGLLIARFSDSFLHCMRWLTMALYLVGFFSFAWFTCILVGTLPSTSGTLSMTVIVGSSAIGATCPLLYEMACECAYPVAEGTASGVLALLNNIGGLVFMFILMTPNIGTMWMNWTMVASILASVLVLVSMPDKHSRLRSTATVHHHTGHRHSHKC